MEIVNKRENYDYGIYYDMESNQADTLKLIKLITIFLQERENIDTNDLYELIKYFYTIKIETKDYLDYLNQTKGTDFDKTVEIPTKRVVMDRTSEGHGRDFSWWQENYQIMIKAATKDFIPSKEEYTEEEINQLINNGIIYPLHPFGKKTKKKSNGYKVNVNYLISSITKELDNKDVYFNFMVNKILSKIGINNFLEEIRRVIISLKLDSIEDEDRYYDEEDYEYLKIYDDLANKLIILYNNINQKNKIKTNHLDIVLDYLKSLPTMEDKWFEKIRLEQIIRVIRQLDYDTDKEVCDEIEKLVILLDDQELCYEMAVNIDWINKQKMAEIVIESGDPDFNYYYASSVEGADIKRHKEVILNSKHSDEYILERAKSLVLEKL